jgi:glutamyl-tRNA(Gln) amidotransferase subunit E
MYPDTDLPPRRITREHLARIAASMPRPFWEWEHWYRELGVPEDVLAPLAASPFAGLFEKAVKEWQLPPVAIGVALVQLPKRVARSTPNHVPLTVDAMAALLAAWRDGVIVRESILPTLAAMASGVPFDRGRLPGLCTPTELDALVQRTLDQLEKKPPADPEKAEQVLMGMVMDQVRGRIDGREVAAALDHRPERDRR